MKLLFLIILSTSFSYAGTCTWYELTGKIIDTGKGMSIMIAEKSLSERKLPFYFELMNKLAPYSKVYVTGMFLLSDKEIVAIKEITEVIPDPLTRNQRTEMKKLKDEACPKN